MATRITLSDTNSDNVRIRNEIRQQLVAKLSDKHYRDIFVSEQINTGLSFQIQAMREAREWSQEELGKKAGMAQSRISLMEDANYSRFTLNTLKRLASAFDVALVVRFEPFSKAVDYFIDLDQSSLKIPGFDTDVLTYETSPLLSFTSTEAAGQPIQRDGIRNFWGNLPTINISGPNLWPKNFLNRTVRPIFLEAKTAGPPLSTLEN